MEQVLKKKKKQRVDFLRKLYELSEGCVSNPINGAEVGAQIGLENGDESILSDTVKYLESEDLVKVVVWLHGLPASVQLTHNGLKEIEDAVSFPDKPTEHFPPINILNVETMIGSNIQQGTVQSSQCLKFNNSSIADIAKFIEELKGSLNDLTLDKSTLQEMKAEIDTVDAQLTSPKPKVSILKECLSSIQRVLEATTGSAIGGHLAIQVPALLALLS
ncbi:hypothetical protein [Vibrio rotiferianus]|uniref:hypothetical protein n=1 Tax=Vibrio rotiferianus TaxID=190895 RepID=UPI003908D674